MIGRRQFLGCVGVAPWAAASVFSLGLGAGSAPRPRRDHPPLESFDQEVQRFMEARKIPGGALAVVRDRKLVYARGYGWADEKKSVEVRADSLFRIASISKPITAAAILKLIERGKLNWDTRAFEVCSYQPIVEAGGKIDERLARITVRQLLQHTGGWDRDQSFDPMFRSREIALAAGKKSPADPATIIRYMLGKRLDFDPGTKFAYSNFGYCVLGRLIEAVTGAGYESFVRKEVLAPLGIFRMKIGRSLASSSGEVGYFTAENARTESVFAAEKEVPWPYGGFCLESMDAHGGWIGSVVDLARFAAGLDGCAKGEGTFLKAGILERVGVAPPPPVSRRADGTVADAYYGLGWMVRPIHSGANFWHTGSLPGTYGLLVRRWDGLDWVVLFNQRSERGSLPDGAIDPALHRAAARVERWPETDLFSEYEIQGLSGSSVP